MTKKKWLYAVLLVPGVALIGLSFLFNTEAVKAVQGVMLGIGTGLLGMSLSSLGMIRQMEKNPHLAKQADIESKDERNVMIRTKSKAASADITRWFIIALAFVMILIDAPLWAILCTIGVYLLYHVLALVFMVRYQKEM